MNMLRPKPRAGNAYGRRLINEARALGWDCGLTGKKHLRFTKGPFAVTAPGTPRDPDRSITALNRSLELSISARPPARRRLVWRTAR